MNKYSEVVIQGPFMLVKGFLLGFLSQTKADSKYFFHRKAGIRRETFKELLKELFELEDHVHVCLESALVEPFSKALELYTKITGNEIKSVKPVSGGWFNFSFEVYNKEIAADIRAIFETLPDGVSLEDYFPTEEQDVSASGAEGYAPLHEYVFRARGKVKGDFEGVMDLFLKIKRGELSDAIVCSEVHLEFE